MRVTAEVRQATRSRILEAARAQFRAKGFAATTTRDIARAAEIATGTLFNYFATKEAIVASLMLDSQSRAGASMPSQAGSLEEALFEHAMDTLRRMKPLRGFLLPVLETACSPLVASARGDDWQSLRTRHLDQVCHLARPFVDEARLNSVALQMYWTLYLGVLTFWAEDSSPKQEDTLALLDQSLAMFASWLVRRDDSGSSD